MTSFPSREVLGALDADDESSGVHASLRSRTTSPLRNGLVVALQIADGDWGDARLDNILRVAGCVASAMGANLDGQIGIQLVHTMGPPMALRALTQGGDFVVRLAISGRHWAQLAFQFAHELCHVIIDPRTAADDRFFWLEEAICEVASHFALRSMARTWRDHPPYPNWRDYRAALWDYSLERTSSSEHTLPDGRSFREWLSQNLPRLEACSTLREENTIVAKELLPIFEAEPLAWRTVRYLHSWKRSGGDTFHDFMVNWLAACPAEERSVVIHISKALGLSFT